MRQQKSVDKNGTWRSFGVEEQNQFNQVFDSKLDSYPSSKKFHSHTPNLKKCYLYS